MHVTRRTLLIIATLLGALLLTAGAPALADGTYTRQERFGIGFVANVPEGDHSVSQSLDQYEIEPLHVGWYSDWHYRATPVVESADGVRLEYAQLIMVKNWPPNWGAIQNAVQHNIGALWMIGNEPECPNQGNLSPEVYADRYKEAYETIKGWDPTARIAIGGIVEPTPLRFYWLEQMLTYYEQEYGEEMPVDVWNIHVHILPEGSYDQGSGTYNTEAGAGVPVGIGFDYQTGQPRLPREYPYTECASAATFKQMVEDFRQWMYDQGEGDKELIISEMGVLEPSIYIVEGGSEAEREERGDQAIEEYMVEVFDWLLTTTDAEVGCPTDENRLVQRWLWFSLNGSFWDQYTNPRGFNSSLYDYQTKDPTRFGRRFIAYQNEHYLTEGLYLPLVIK